MKLQPTLTQANGVISVSIQAQFVGDLTDQKDKALIAAFGDPTVNVAGQFTDPNNQTFRFQFPSTQNIVGITTQLSTVLARFMLSVPSASNGTQMVPQQGPMDCITPNPGEAAQAWYSAVSVSIGAAMTTLRTQTLVPTLNAVSV